MSADEEKPDRLRAEDVWFGYGDVRALAGVSAELAGGEVLCIVGPNGAGKSTLLRVLAGALAPDRGAVTLGGRPLASFGGRARARSVAFLAQENVCAFPYSAREVVLMGRVPHVGTFGFETEHDRAAAEQAIAAVRLEGLAERAVSHLSAGERQRVFLAMALAQEPRCLLLDEPTVYLDLRHQVETFLLVRALARERGLAVAVVTHDLGLAARFADRVLLLGSGKAVATGTPREVMSARLLSDAYGTEIAVVPLPDGSLAVLPAVAPVALGL
ncbi:MAG: ABC transporter ATP-binding protein [Planctomycetes bacterium]|nr:ABC transporter ATP-binding protein [Planctomycetota bacterium]